jgi:hypothetical protein
MTVSLGRLCKTWRRAHSALLKAHLFTYTDGGGHSIHSCCKIEDAAAWVGENVAEISKVFTGSCWTCDVTSPWYWWRFEVIAGEHSRTLGPLPYEISVIWLWGLASHFLMQKMFRRYSRTKYWTRFRESSALKSGVFTICTTFMHVVFMRFVWFSDWAIIISLYSIR